MEKKKYYCIFNEKQECPVKTEYKLMPESLIEFCRVCITKCLDITAERELQRLEARVPTVTEWASRHIEVSLENRQLYEYFCGKGYNRSLGQFVNETLDTYFRDKGMTIGLIVELELDKEGVDTSIEKDEKKKKGTR